MHEKCLGPRERLNSCLSLLPRKPFNSAPPSGWMENSNCLEGWIWKELHLADLAVSLSLCCSACCLVCTSIFVWRQMGISLTSGLVWGRWEELPFFFSPTSRFHLQTFSYSRTECGLGTCGTCGVGRRGGRGSSKRQLINVLSLYLSKINLKKFL